MPGGAHDLPARVRAGVTALLLILVVPGVLGVEAWPLTSWRLFSATRTDTQTRWTVQAVTPNGEAVPVRLDRLALGYRNVEATLPRLRAADRRRRDQVCQAILGGVRASGTDVQGLRIVRDRQRLVPNEAGWTVRHHPRVFHTCQVGEAGP